MGLLSDMKSSLKGQEASKDAETTTVAPPAYPASSSSTLPPPPQVGTGPFFPCVLLSSSDKLRILGFPNEEDIKVAIETSITRAWTPGIQRSGPFEAGGWEWKMSGRPWYGHREEGTHSRRLIASVLYELCVRGWHLMVSSSLTKKEWDKDTLIFRAGPPVQRYFFPVSYHESDKIRIIDSPNDQVTQDIMKAIQNAWIPGIQDQKQKGANSYQIKLKGRPWYTSDGVTINHARLLVIEILKAMDAHGFELLASVDLTIGQTGNDSGITDIDTWFFVSKM